MCHRFYSMYVVESNNNKDRWLMSIDMKPLADDLTQNDVQKLFPHLTAPSSKGASINYVSKGGGLKSVLFKKILEESIHPKKCKNCPC